MSSTATVDLTLTQGEDFAVQIYWVDGDVNPFTVLSPMRMDIKSDVGTTVYSLFTDDSAVDPEIPTILYNSEAGLIQLMIPAGDSATLSPGIYRYDLWVTYQDNAITNTTRLRPLIEGSIYVNGRVTTAV